MAYAITFAKTDATLTRPLSDLRAAATFRRDEDQGASN
jgi:hypothetical protein